MKKETPFLDLHYSIISGEESEKFMVPPTGNVKKRLWNGLCYVVMDGKYLNRNDIFNLFRPFNDEEWGYWASDDFDHSDDGIPYTSLRQNIILFCAAINEEI